MRRGPPVVALALAAALAGCGGDSAEEEIRATVEGYLEAVADGDAERACGLLTENAQLGVWEFKRVHEGPDHPDEACAATVEKTTPRRGLERLRAAEVERVEVDGDRARAVVEGADVGLRRAGGDWRIDTFGLAGDVTGEPLFAEPQ